MKEYYEELWQRLPYALEPYACAQRREFLLSHVRAGMRVLDFGCGEGQFTAALLAAGAEAVGVDIAQAALERARQGCPDGEFRLLDAGGELPLADNSVGLVWAGEVIEHVADTARLFSEIRRVLQPGGELLITTPSHGRLRRALIALARFEGHFNPVGEHLRFYTRRSLSELLEQFGFEQLQVREKLGWPLLRTTIFASAQKARTTLSVSA